MWKILIGKLSAVQLIICGKYQYHVENTNIMGAIVILIGK